jgi:small subunit ribosomal protein S6|tara:strand:- start:1294 stop:1623 length:330 start_codon:yes stop_codon:yes gene_type:complete
MQKEYEILYIIKPHLGDEKTKIINDNLQSWITSSGGEVTLFKDLGLRDLGTEFNKNKQGYYSLCQFKGNEKVLTELNEKLGVTEDIIRYLNVKLEDVEAPGILEAEPQV